MNIRQEQQALEAKTSRYNHLPYMVTCQNCRLANWWLRRVCAKCDTKLDENDKEYLRRIHVIY